MSRVVLWRRTDVEGLERLELTEFGDGVEAVSDLVCAEDGGFSLRHRWWLTADWSARRLEVEKSGPDGGQRLVVEREGDGWRVDGEVRDDLHGAEEPDLSVTPFCNTFAVRRLSATVGATLTLDTCYLDAAAMRVVRSRQRYVRLGPHRVRYEDLGTAPGFVAALSVDDLGLVVDYEHLFARVEP